tara:strand:- start:1362 stop:1469 length:108 start_codon:yes stop_codon:yes gene_type:complete
MVSEAVKVAGSIIKLIDPNKGAMYVLRNFFMKSEL